MEQTIGVELLEPLAILHVRLAPGHLARVMGIDQLDIKATLFEHFEQGNPVDAGRLHYHDLNLTLSQQSGQDVETTRNPPKPPNRVLLPTHMHTTPCLS